MNPETLKQIIGLFMENQEIESINLNPNTELGEAEFKEITEKFDTKTEYTGFADTVEEYIKYENGRIAKMIVSYQENGEKIKVLSVYMYRELRLTNQ